MMMMMMMMMMMVMVMVMTGWRRASAPRTRPVSK
jgi:hypothetical protein